MAAISRKRKGSKSTFKNMAETKDALNKRESTILPMMPRHFSAKEREEIREKESRILKGNLHYY